MNAVVVALLFAFVSPMEQTYGPYLAPPSGGEPAIVASHDRVLLAWSELDPLTRRAAIHTGVLDFDGQLVSAIHTLPPWQAGSEATDPSVASNGRTFAVAWLEGDHKRLAATALDTDGAPVAEPLRLGIYADASVTPPLLWTGEAYQLAQHELHPNRTVAYAFDSNGARATPSMVTPAYPRYADGNTQVGMKWTSAKSVYRCGWGIGHGCSWTDPEFVVSWEFIRGAHYEAGSTRFLYYSESRAVTAGDADELAVVWRSPTRLTGIRVVDEQYQSTFTILESPTAPEPDGIAFDGERWLVVFTRDDDIWGAFVDRTSKRFEPFPIATSGRAETKARPIALAPGRFLVSYTSDLGPDDHRFAGRIVSTEPPPTKRRAVR